MKIVADLHIHSHFARACSRDLIPGNLGTWADKKGISVIGTGDFTHPGWLAELEASLIESKPGLYALKDNSARAMFMLSSEVASIYKQGDKVRRVHNLIFVPSFEAVHKLNTALEARKVNLKSDGRPIMGLRCDELLKICKDVDEKIELIPAHAWTPHFGVFGSLSGFDLLSEAFGDQTKHIFAIETGLSSDPKMNWQVSDLDDIALISNSDAHSLRKLGREANVFEIPEDQLSFDSIIKTIRDKNPKTFLYTIEFFPEEGKYHLDGHRDHDYSSWPEETKKNNGICPECGKKLLRGVMHRVDDLGDREYGFIPQRSIPFKSIIPLEEIIAETFGVGTASKKVLEQYEAIVKHHSEFDILLELSEQEITTMSSSAIAQSITRVREGKVHIEPGYDGVFGKIQIYSPEEREKLSLKPKQATLF
jgi:uncharacterized protein (TIGR00375 family)